MLNKFCYLCLLLLFSCILESATKVENMTPSYLYKILSIENWKMSQDTLQLPPEDSPFIHFSTEEQLPRIIEKYWSHIPEFMVLKIETQKLVGKLVFENNPGGTVKYYHLYNGFIPKEAICESTLVQGKK